MSYNKLEGTMEAYKSMVSENVTEITEKAQTFKSLEDWVKAVLSIRGTSITMFGNNLSAQGLGRKGSATFELKKGRGSLVESVELDEKKKLDPVNDKENDKEFKDREDNDGDVDSSDEFLHKKRAATDDAIDAEDGEEKKDIKKNPKTKDAKAEISKIESVNTRESFLSMWADLEEAVNQKKDAAAPEAIDSKESPKSKEFIAKHKKSDKKIEDSEEEGHDVTFKAGGKTMKQAKQPK
jgi:flagellum-specific peptidoglycan hydrolase FlgJ